MTTGSSESDALRQAHLAGTLIALEGSNQGFHRFPAFVQAFQGAAANGFGCQKAMAFSRGDGRKSDCRSHIGFHWY